MASTRDLPPVVDLFCGIGGLTHGFILEGFPVAAGVDSDESCRRAYERNNDSRFVHADVEAMGAADLIALYPKSGVRVLVGCAPCQPFSKNNNRNPRRTDWRLVRTFAELIGDVRPDVVSMENVPELEKHRVFDEFVDTLTSAGYDTSWSLVQCVDYGVPQNRNLSMTLRHCRQKFSDVVPLFSRLRAVR